MHIYLDDEKGLIENDTNLWEKINAVVEQTLDLCKVPYEVEVSLTVVSKEEIQNINLTHRNLDKPTDVLSFPQLEGEIIGQIDWDELDTNDCMNFDTEEIILGDIILCFEIAQEQAEAYNHSLEREICFLVAHSMLHLLGYDHMTHEDEKQMLVMQNSILDKLHIIR
jgi:probable rRNA maturation factor